MRRYRSIADRKVAQACLHGVGAVLHAASLHKPHVGCNNRQAFIDTNIAGTLVLLRKLLAGVESFVFTSTTSTFGLWIANALVTTSNRASGTAGGSCRSAAPCGQGTPSACGLGSDTRRRGTIRNGWCPACRHAVYSAALAVIMSGSPNCRCRSGSRKRVMVLIRSPVTARTRTPVGYAVGSSGRLR
jgi:hypothetical protein